MHLITFLSRTFFFPYNEYEIELLYMLRAFQLFVLILCTAFLHLFPVIFEHTIPVESDIRITYYIRYISSQLFEGIQHYAYFVDNVQVVNIGRTE